MNHEALVVIRGSEHYNIVKNPAVKQKYPDLYEEVVRCDALSYHGIYVLSATALNQYHQYQSDQTIPKL